MPITLDAVLDAIISYTIIIIIFFCTLFVFIINYFFFHSTLPTHDRSTYNRRSAEVIEVNENWARFRFKETSFSIRFLYIEQQIDPFFSAAVQLNILTQWYLDRNSIDDFQPEEFKKRSWWGSSTDANEPFMFETLITPECYDVNDIFC